MPLLFPPGTRVFDADGAPLNDAQIRVYQANTTTPADLFSDTGLTVALSNPVITNAEGYPTSDGSNECLIWVASGDYDVAFLTSGGAVIVSWDDAPTFGEEAGELDRTVSGLGRFKVTGSAGAVLIQVGDPSPDNSGGTLTIEGWAGTQGDSITLDFATTNTSGTLKENSKRILGVVNTEVTTAAAAAQIIIALPNSPTGTIAYELDIWDMVFAGVAANLRAQLSYDGGATYKSGANDYIGRVYGATTGASFGSLDTYLQFCSGVLATSARPGRFRVEIITSNSSAELTQLLWHGLTHDNAGTPLPDIHMGGGLGLGGYGRATHIKFFLSTGSNLSGKYIVRTLRGYGEA